jgi:hypothetical protein
MKRLNWVFVVTAALIAATLLVTGCALEPDHLSIEAQHVSHVSQHFGPNPTNFGYNTIGLDARWENKRASFDISEGAVLEACQHYIGALGALPECGGLAGPRETFNARVNIYVWSKQE